MSFLISIIIPVFNKADFLSKCLTSITSQTYQHLEIILINDGSTDSSGVICDSFANDDKRIRVIHQLNSGVSASRNAGLNIATGNYISFIDPDDWIEPHMYETLAKYVLENNADILRFNAYRKGEIINELPFSGTYLGDKLENEVMLPLIGAEKFGGIFILGVLWLHLYKKEIIEKNHIRFNTALRRCEDRLFTLTTVLYANKMVFVKDILYHYEVFDDSLSNKYDSERWQQELIYLSALQTEYKKCKSAEFSEAADKRIETEYLLRAVTSVNNEFFSRNKNSFLKKYKNTKAIIDNSNVKRAVKDIAKEKMGLKGNITIGLIKFRQAFLLSSFNTLLLLKNSIKNG